MADYLSVTRTNYFHVKDREKFLGIMENVLADETMSLAKNTVWEEKDPKGGMRYGFGLYGGIYGMQGEDDADSFFKNLQECLADGDAIIILSAGHEKLRYVSGDATIITPDRIEFLNLASEASRLAAEMLGDEGWETQCDY